LSRVGSPAAPGDSGLAGRWREVEFADDPIAAGQQSQPLPTPCGDPARWPHHGPAARPADVLSADVSTDNRGMPPHSLGAGAETQADLEASEKPNLDEPSIPIRSGAAMKLATSRRIWFWAAALLLAPVGSRGQTAAGHPTDSPLELTLERAVAIALEKNPELKSVEDESRAAKARIGQAQASWYPRLDFVQGFARGNNPVYVFGTLLAQRRFSASDFALNRLNTPTPLDNFQTRVDGAWTLFDSFRTVQRVRGAKRMATAAEFHTEQARQDLILRVVRAYTDVIVARDGLAAAREALRTAEENEARVRSFEKAGTVVMSDLLSAQVFRAQMKEDEILAANRLEIARLILARELGTAPEAMGEPSGRLTAPTDSTKSREDWEKIALAERPALRAAELERAAAANQRGAAKTEFGPKVSLFANVERDALTLGGSSGTNWIAGARLDLNLFAGGADKYRLAEAEAKVSQADHQLEWFRSGIQLEVRQAYLESQAAGQRSAAAREAVAQAQESLRIIQNRYQAGLTTITELLRAQAAQLEAQTASLSALHDWQLARAQLERAAGSLNANSEVLKSFLQ
jgi:outer membrane protein